MVILKIIQNKRTGICPLHFEFYIVFKNAGFFC